MGHLIGLFFYLKEFREMRLVPRTLCSAVVAEPPIMCWTWRSEDRVRSSVRCLFINLHCDIEEVIHFR